MSNCCPHVTKSTGHINDEEWNRIVSNPFCDTCQEQGINFWLCLHPGCHAIGCSDADGGILALCLNSIHILEIRSLVFDKYIHLVCKNSLVFFLGQDHSTEHYNEHPTHSIQVSFKLIFGKLKFGISLSIKE